MNGGRRCPTTVTDAAGVDDDEIASGRRHRPTTATTVADVANVDDNEATNGGRRRPTACHKPFYHGIGGIIIPPKNGATR